MKVPKILSWQDKSFYKLIMALLSRHSVILFLYLICALTTSAQTRQNLLRPSIERITNKLRKDNEVHFGYPVGFSGKPETSNKYYKLYLKLMDKATDQELALLTKDTSQCIVAYSFDILWRRQYSNLKDIFFQHQNDTTFFWTASGCTGILNRINWFMLKRLKPNQNSESKNWLTIEEYDLYCNKFHKADNLFACN